MHIGRALCDCLFYDTRVNVMRSQVCTGVEQKASRCGTHWQNSSRPSKFNTLISNFISPCWTLSHDPELAITLRALYLTNYCDSRLEDGWRYKRWWEDVKRWKRAKWWCGCLSKWRRKCVSPLGWILVLVLDCAQGWRVHFASCYCAHAQGDCSYIA